ncbi:Sensor histidine kinase DesK [Microbacterium hydrocarbonoxydans]|uniref:histidine kinase n=2 Tax=Microbacterium hydrocarbonoxydans TaxID=273678 RepID=A0A0M2HVZ3_9MICO|nr:Sensor histidine kinase DesK [Microbacterium hydrocarbonoxydans]
MSDLLAIALYVGLAAFAWHPTTAAFTVVLISCVGVVPTGSGGDLLELALTLSLVSATGAPWLIVTHATLLMALTAYVAIGGETLAGGGIFSIAGIATIAFLIGIGFRLVAARETVLVAERARITMDLEELAREDQERIADELHDGIAHDLTLVLFHARALPKQPDEEARQVSLSTIEESAERALRSIQALLSLMRDIDAERPKSANRYGGDVIRAIVTLGGLLNDAGIPTRVSTPSPPVNLTQATELILIETAIEAVTNIIKHAPNSHSASIEIHSQSECLELSVKNTFTALTPRSEVSSTGRGLARAEQRVAQCLGHLKHGRTAEGWNLLATVPSSQDKNTHPYGGA